MTGEMEPYLLKAYSEWYDARYLRDVRIESVAYEAYKAGYAQAQADAAGKE